MKLVVKNLKYFYQDGSNSRTVLDNINYTFESGKTYAIVGKSGAGKTTLLSLLSGLEKSMQGEIMYNEKNLNEIGYDIYRRNNIGIVFQNYNLLSYMTALQNVRVAMGITENDVTKINPQEILELLGITVDKINRPVSMLSGGEQQRVAIARSLSTNVGVLFADEPTGNLDESTTNEIIKVLIDLAHKNNKCVIIVTHNREVTELMDYLIELKDGRIINKNSEVSQDEFI